MNEHSSQPSQPDATNAAAAPRRRPARHQRNHGRRQHKNQAAPRPFTPEQLSQRATSVPTITYPAQLPVSARQEEIAAAILANQVVIVAGETGSGKTTQIPKICLDLGRGVNAMIGHTQPRRIAARSVAERIAQELGTKVSKESIVGYQVRFTDEVSEHTLIKLMTDGILLAEIQNDPLLRRYDTLIIDEAHERSLNIDFILGYLARLLPQRPDLKVIITSATIDSERFAAHFGVEGRPAPIIEVSGRTYPVEIRYRPLDGVEPEPASSQTNSAAASASTDEPRDQVTGILDAVDELMALGPGDILVFLAGERDIRDTEAALIDHLGPRYAANESSARLPGSVEIIPLYSRLSAAAQHRVFEKHRLRRIVLATNVAETSLTVPSIRYVIDPGVARISRYSNKTKVQRLPIEPISQASANQRSGRCGRVADGVAIRLYSQTDYEGREPYTEPEILRTSLASVILQMAALRLGNVADFPFIDPPDRRAIADGVALLTEIGAISANSKSMHEPRLTAIGHQLARLPIDPRLGRMLLEANKRGCASEVMVIVSALSIQDVRERPLDAQEAADAMHRRLADPTSDFLTYLNFWRYLRTQSRDLSGSAFRRMCRHEYLHYLRIREWRDVYNQLAQLARPLGINAQNIELPTRASIRAASDRLVPGSHAAGMANADVADAVVALGQSADTPDADAIHQSLLVGLLSNLGNYDERRREYAGARATHFTIWPGSGLRRKQYDWVMAAELVETSRLFARTVARIQPQWVEQAAKHLVKVTYGEPYWSTKKGAAMVHQRVLLYGLTLVADRPVTLASVGTDAARQAAREMFIRSGLVEGGWHARHAFVERNRELLEDTAEVERRHRTHGILADDQALFDFYDERLPEKITSAAAFDNWWKHQRQNTPKLLDFTRELLLPEGDNLDGYPDTWHQGDLTLALTYVFEPGRLDDGVSVQVPIEVLTRLRPEGFDWLVPGMRPQLCVATIRALPKRVRRQLVPAPDTGARIWELICQLYPQAAGEASDGVAASGTGTSSAPGGGASAAASQPGVGSNHGGVEPIPVSFQQAFTQAAQQLRQVEITDEDWGQAQENLPEHLRMGFSVLDARGNKLGRGRNLIVLQRQLAKQSEAAVRSAVRGALAAAMDEARSKKSAKSRRKNGAHESHNGVHGAAGANGSAGAHNGGNNGAHNGARANKSAANTFATITSQSLTSPLKEQTNLVDWPEVPQGVIPQQIESAGRAGLLVRGYPTLVAQPTSKAFKADLKILADVNSQLAQHAEGVLALALARTPLETARVTSRWNAKRSLFMVSAPYKSTDTLVSDLCLAAGRLLAQQWSRETGHNLAQLRDRKDFEVFVAWLRDRLEDQVEIIAAQVEAALEAKGQLDKAVGRNTSLALLDTLQEIREQAAALIAPRFIADADPAQLAHYGRYLKSLAYRLEKAAASPSQDAALAYQVREIEGQVSDAVEHAKGLPANPARAAVLRQAQNMVWELRVSLFAQQLGTAHKVSAKRISRLLASAPAL
ncbi:ATP-dependent helicase HrpA [Actinomyces graevenitzii F0530]|uniref:ATP-dependent helicase HrpA n=1 Tax=Actinomyces graevenitzii F0530 TaxID=1321817 RepID=U1PR32_9ACTO|nr:ATP-dependent RNA helicase HrpA [Actinomyces graevenitzii]ERH18535.1 ATP-dependent helicase HrpA [Actinomyces graevenitzii F0530]